MCATQGSSYRVVRANSLANHDHATKQGMLMAANAARTAASSSTLSIDKIAEQCA